jgi:hypothetical protein
MAFPVLRTAAALVCATLIASLPTPVLAQNPDADAKAAAEAKAAGQAGQRELEQIAEAARQMTGPAANVECIWHGIRVVSLLHRDDLDTAFRQLQIYDRFGCPGGHVQTAFRCYLRPSGPRDPKSGDARFDQQRALECWINPSPAAPATAATSTPPAARPGTTNR